jgi:hypothetical protein
MPSGDVKIRDQSLKSPVQCRVVAVNSSHATEESEARTRAYGKVVDLLVGFRRIVRRGSVRLWGEEWFDTGCPVTIRERLIEAREAELEVERSSSETQEPYELATFGDLADMVESSESLEVLLQGLSLSPDGLIANLRTLEDLRRKLAQGRSVSDSEGIVLDELHLRMREKLTGARRRSRGVERDRATEHGSSDRPAGNAEGAHAPSGAPTPPDTPGERARATEALFGSGGEVVDADRSVPSTNASAPPRPVESKDVLFDDQGAEGTSGRYEEDVFDGAETPVGLVHVRPEDFQVLRDLRLEIINAAEAAYGHAPDIDSPVWHRLMDSGWYAERAEAYGLAEVAKFYAIVELFSERVRAGEDRDDLNTFLADCELAKMLLRLRDLFIRLRV